MLKCPKCGYVFEEHTCVSGTKKNPSEGDILVCINCGAVLQYSHGRAIELSDEEYTRLPPETKFQIRDIVDAVHRMGDIHENP